ncbi:hypothetical protein ASPWEDRAFT_180292 [Aspergillus wentii DTO 134E9]|uniref:Uncharacterized protein n=1 Tax=Aspergillus wentii DTO 134E9 TaxID=1073089 RepID=A0A1L9RV63_ASPWE|nr:uncharacterized protein ASPWEDRAFT_180292 [Aspergillus wentii DTO 134E9]KAI9928719.1 hypothetical protein MW887_001936 [Aspergillus wentii]OJJ38812.1 hypothetical protein ASPWEDRAFT_180292 [Aspergillus wentii DTO 134E9]
MTRFTSFLLTLTGFLQSASSAAVDTSQDLVPASKSLSARQNIESNTPLLKYFISPKGQIPRCPNDAEQVPYTKKDYYYKCEKDGHFAEGFSRVNIKHWCCFNPVQEIFFFPEAHVNFLGGQTVTPDSNIMIDGADCCRNTIRGRCNMERDLRDLQL